MNICESICPCNQCSTEPEDCELAKAFEKTIPKKPTRDCGEYYCPHCDEWIDELQVGKNQFCADCGGALDWGKYYTNINL